MAPRNNNQTMLRRGRSMTTTNTRSHNKRKSNNTTNHAHALIKKNRKNVPTKEPVDKNESEDDEEKVDDDVVDEEEEDRDKIIYGNKNDECFSDDENEHNNEDEDNDDESDDDEEQNNIENQNSMAFPKRNLDQEKIRTVLQRKDNIINKQKEMIAKMKQQQEQYIPPLGQVITGNQAGIGTMSAVTAASAVSPKELTDGNKMSLGVYITSTIFQQIKFVRDETIQRYPELIDGCVAFMLAGQQPTILDGVAYKTAVEKYLREKTSNLRSYAKKQIKKKFLGKQQ
jgi:hypothetical protein